MDFHGKTALITGASSGIGLEFANTVARGGGGVILVARSADKLAQIATELSGSYGVRAEVVVADLSLPGAADEVVAQVERSGLEVDLLVNNAGFGTHGLLADADPARIREEVSLNVGALTDLTTAYLHTMTKRGSGAIINVASTAALQPIPRMAVYGATKAYVLALSEALWWEGKQKGVKVMALCPGATDTEFFQVVGSDDASVGARRTTRQVVETAFKALDSGAPSVVDGWQNRISGLASRLAPRRLVIAIAERAVRPAK